MGLRYVNPAKGRRTAKMPAALRRYWNARKKKARGKRSKVKVTKLKLKKKWGRFGTIKKSSRAAKAAKTGSSTIKRKKKKMSRKKLYGAAARAHAKKLRRGKKSGKRKSSKRSRAAKKAARTRMANKMARRAAARKGARKRKHGGHRKARKGVHKIVRRKKRKYARKVAAYSRKRKHYAKKTKKHGRKRRGGRPTTQRSLARARRSIRNRRKTSLGRAYARRHHMRSNPTSLSGVMGLFKQVIPVAASLYGARALSSKLLTKNIPGISSIPAQYQGTVVAGVLVVGGHFLTKKVKGLNKFHDAVMIGTGINLVDNLLMAFAPPNVKSMFGLADYVEMGMSDYVAVGRPIDDDITLSGMSDYIAVGASVEEELGLEEELGASVEEELGADVSQSTGYGGLSRAYLGGVSQGSMLRQIPSRPMLAPIPERSFTRDVRKMGAGYDNADVLYGGIFRD